MTKGAQIDWKAPDEVVKTQLLELVPAGTSVEQARQIMEQNGFQCDDRPAENDKPRTLSCQMDDIESWPVFKSVRATFRVDEDNTVSLTDVKSRLTGP
jgi:hypothetical protein